MAEHELSVPGNKPWACFKPTSPDTSSPLRLGLAAGDGDRAHFGSRSWEPPGRLL